MVAVSPSSNSPLTTTSSVLSVANCHPMAMTTLSPQMFTNPCLITAQSSFPWSQLQFTLSSGSYSNSCAYDTSFHCAGAIYNLIDITQKHHLLDTQHSGGFHKLNSLTARQKDPHSLKMALWSWLANCSQSGLGAIASSV